MNYKNNLIGAAAALLILAASCSAPKNMTYFENNRPGTEQMVTAPQPIKIEPNDKLSIVVSTSDPRLNQLFNLPIARNQLGNSNGATSYSGDVAPYTVDKSGNIDFPVLGKLHIAGMSREQVAEYVRRELISRDLAKNPIVTVDFLNLAVSVMGEVNRPGRVNIDREDYTLLEALSQAGDLTIFGKRDNIKVLRTENGVQKTYMVDLNKANDLTNSPVYYLKQNDVVYVEPNDTKKRNSTPNGNQWSTPGLWLSLLGSALSVATLVITLTRK